MLHNPFNWKRLSLAGALAYEPDGSDAHLFFELRPGAYNDETLIEFLSELYEAEQRTVLLIWDGLPSHRSRRMSDWVAMQRHWLSVERLPGYAPDLNPIENVWGNLKSQELANLCSNTIDQVADIAEGGLDRYYSAFEVGHLDATRFEQRVSALEAHVDALRAQDAASPNNSPHKPRRRRTRPNSRRSPTTSKRPSRWPNPGRRKGCSAC